MSIFGIFTLGTVGFLSLLFIGLSILTVQTLLKNSSPFDRSQKNILTFWLIVTILSGVILIKTFSTHDRNIAIIISTACICFWSIYIFRDGNTKRIRESPQNIAIMLLILSFVIITYGLEYIYDSQSANLLNKFVSDFYANSGAELVSIAITIIVLDRLNDRKNDKDQLDELIVQLRSPNPNTVIEAIQMLDAKGWLNDVFKDNSDIDLPDGTSWSDSQNIRKFTHPQEWQTEQKMKIANYADVLKTIENHTFDLIQVAPEYRADHRQVERYHPSLYPVARVSQE